jgi:two-component system repressor protein LuxO
MLKAHPWPGNVRELANAIQRAVVLGDGGSITAAMLPAEMRYADTPEGTIAPFALQERRIIERAIAARGGNVVEAADALAISPSTIYRKLQTWRLTG